MKHPLFLRRAAVLIAVTIMSLGTAAVAANAEVTPRSTNAPSVITTSSVSPDFTCPSPTLCIFQKQGFTGLVGIVDTSVHNHWVSLTADLGLALPWGSFNDNSGSSVVFGDAQTGAKRCFPPHTRINAPGSVGSDRWVWIEFGVPDCTGKVGPLP